MPMCRDRRFGRRADRRAQPRRDAQGGGDREGRAGRHRPARAQGGIAAVLEEGDSFEAHVNDTMIAGAGLNDIRVVEHVVSQAPGSTSKG